jgi:hypothetical protein
MKYLALSLTLLLGCTTPAPAIDAARDAPTTSDAIASAVDITNTIFTRQSGDCSAYAGSYVSEVTDVQRSLPFVGHVDITVDATACHLTSNAIPSHDFDDASAHFATLTIAITKTFDIPRNPTMAATPTALTLMTYDAVMLDGVVVDLLSAGCYGVGDGHIGCSDLSTPWRYDPMSPSASFGTDMHHAHTQPDGRYHYHGDPLAMYGDGTHASPVIGFAADGFPIYGPYFDDGTGVRAARSGYVLRTGTRSSGPGGTYDGTYVDDYVFTGAGDLDQCNGMTIGGQYGYYVTSSYPWILGCLRGTVNHSFDKGMP